MKRIYKLLSTICLSIFLISCVNLDYYKQKPKFPDKRSYGLTYMELLETTKRTLKDLNIKIEKEDYNKGIIEGKDYKIRLLYISNHITAIKIDGEKQTYESIFNHIEKLKDPDILNLDVKW